MNIDRKDGDCCQVCEKCAKCGKKFFCIDRHWLIRALIGEQRVPSYGWCNHFKRLQTQRVK